MLSLVYSPDYTPEWPGHVFPVEKYRLVHERLLSEGIAAERDFLRPGPAPDALLGLVHSESYLRRLERLSETPSLGYLEFEVPVSPRVLNAFKVATSGSVLAAREALARGAAVNLGGGFHHAFADRGEGSCLLNDIAVAVLALRSEGAARRVAIIDCDLHQGNGTAKIFQGDPDVFTFSIHQEDLYPVKQQSDWDIGLEDFAGDDEYLPRLADAVPKILDAHRPELAIYVAGADPFEEDQLGGLGLTRDGLRRRDRLVFNAALELNVPLVVTLAGGYARRLDDTVQIHATTVEEAIRAFEG